MLLRIGRYPDAVESSRKVVGMFHPGMTAKDRYDAYVTLASACLPAGDAKGALEAARAAIKLRPEAYEGHMYAATALMLLLEYGEATEAFERALERCPKNAQIEQHVQSRLAVARSCM